MRQPCCFRVSFPCFASERILGVHFVDMNVVSYRTVLQSGVGSVGVDRIVPQDDGTEESRTNERSVCDRQHCAQSGAVVETY